MLSIVTWKWAKPGYRSWFRSEHVNIMRAMVERHYPEPHRVVCITDDPEGIDERVMTVPLWALHGDLLNPTWPGPGPSCYRRLRAFSPEFAEIAGERFVSIDLDVVITGDMRPLWNRDEDFIMYASKHAHGALNGSMFMMRTGARAHVWEDFDPIDSPKLTHAAGLTGSDQAWIEYCLGRRKEATWTEADGIYAWRQDCKQRRAGALPEGARLVVFHGKPDPWDPVARAASPWIAEHFSLSGPTKARRRVVVESITVGA
jgi:hypothetical protein